MKEATGELNMTVITVVAIAAIGTLFTVFVWPMVKNNITRSTYCANVVSCTNCNGDTCECSYYDADNNLQTGLLCPDSSATNSGGTTTNP